MPIGLNELYRSEQNGSIGPNQDGTILGEWQAFKANPIGYEGSLQPDCMEILFDELWLAHASHRLDPKYHLFKREAARVHPEAWVQSTLGAVMQRREDMVDFEEDPDKIYQVMTISQMGEIRAREAGKGKNYPEWRGTYFMDSPGTWYAGQANDVVFSSIDLWKGCISVIPEAFDNAVVTKEFPIYAIQDRRLSPAFLQVLLRSRYYQRAFRAITTGHSNRRRTQVTDFEELEIAFPADRDEQDRLVADILRARREQTAAAQTLRGAVLEFSDMIDGRGDEELPDIEDEAGPEDALP